MKQKSITKVIKICDKTMEQMVIHYEPLKREKTPPYAVLQAIDGDTVVTIYQSGKVMFQGKDADLASDWWIETEKINNPLPETSTSNDDNKKTNINIPINISSIGSDEVGTGDYFGPIIVTASYVSKDNIEFVTSLGVKDSKKLTDKQILEIVPKLITKIPYHSYILDNKTYNSFHNDNMNMNKMKAILHNKVLHEFIKENKYTYDYIVIDQFESEKSFYNHIKDSIYQTKKITFMTKAEDKCLSVACASLISRYLFIKQMDKLSKDLDDIIPYGAGVNVDEFGKKIVAKYGKNKLEDIAKLNFKNTNRIID